MFSLISDSVSCRLKCCMFSHLSDAKMKSLDSYNYGKEESCRNLDSLLVGVESCTDTCKDRLAI